jgi:hypothetical protein
LSAGDTDHDGCGSRFVFDFFASDVAGMGILGAAGVGNAIYGNPHGLAFCAGHEHLLIDIIWMDGWMDGMREKDLQESILQARLAVCAWRRMMGWQEVMKSGGTLHESIDGIINK